MKPISENCTQCWEFRFPLVSFLHCVPPPHPKEQLAAGIHRASDALTSALPGRQPQSKDELGGGDGDAAAEVGKGHLERVSLGD